MAKKSKGKGRAVKNARRKFGIHYESEDLKLAPHTMVIKRGVIDNDTKDLMSNMRQVMEPFTAASLKVTKKNTLKDFVSIAGPMHVTHLIVLSQTELGDYMKFIRLPRGPSLHFKLIDFSTCNDVLNSMKRKHTHKKQFLHQPLLVINGFNMKDEKTGQNYMEPQHKLLTTTLQNMFPSINVTKVQLDDIRRCVLFNYNKEDNTIDFRQYYIRLAPVGLSKPVKKLNQEKLPDLSKFQDISEYIEKGGNMSESEFEDGPENQVTLKKDMIMRGATNLEGAVSAIRLSEIGPRLKIKLVKIEEGICDGEVLYHEYVKKTPDEVAEIREKLKTRKQKEKVKQKEKADKQAADDKKKGIKRDKKTRDNLSQWQNPKDTEYDEAQENRDYYMAELGVEPDNGFDQKTKEKSFKRKREQNDENEQAKLLKSNGYEDLVNGDNGHKKKLRSDQSENGADSKFSVKFEKEVTKNKPAKFFKVSNKKASNK